MFVWHFFFIRPKQKLCQFMAAVTLIILLLPFPPSSVQAKIVEVEQRQGKAQGLAQTYESRVSEIKKGVLELEAKVDELMGKIEEAVGRATKACERMETTRDPKSIEREMAKLQQKVREKGPGWASFGMGGGGLCVLAEVKVGCVVLPL